MPTQFSSQYVDIPVFNALVPSEGPKAVPLTFDFTMQTVYSVDLQNPQSRGIIQQVQTIYLDNSGNAGALSVLVNQSNQLIVCPPYSQGYFPVLAPNPFKFLISCASGGANTNVYLLNVPVAANVWSANQGTGNTYSSGKLIVTDPVLDAAINGQYVQTLQAVTGTAGTSYPQWMGNLTVSGQASNTVANVITGNPGYFLTGVQLMISPNAAKAAAGDWTLTLSDSSSGAVWIFDAFVPATSPTLTAGAAVQLATPSGFLWNNKVGSSALSLTASAALTTGKYTYNLCYGQTSVVG